MGVEDASKMGVKLAPRSTQGGSVPAIGLREETYKRFVTDVLVVFVVHSGPQRMMMDATRNVGDAWKRLRGITADVSRGHRMDGRVVNIRF